MNTYNNPNLRDRTYQDTWETRDTALNGLSYSEYLASPEWKEVRRIAKTLSHYSYCWLCSSRNDLDLHHRSYKWIGTINRMRGIVAVCRSCHKKIHDYAKENNVSVRLATNRLRRENKKRR